MSGHCPNKHYYTDYDYDGYDDYYEYGYHDGALFDISSIRLLSRDDVYATFWTVLIAAGVIAACAGVKYLCDKYDVRMGKVGATILMIVGAIATIVIIESVVRMLVFTIIAVSVLGHDYDDDARRAMFYGFVASVPAAGAFILVCDVLPEKPKRWERMLMAGAITMITSLIICFVVFLVIVMLYY